MFPVNLCILSELKSESVSEMNRNNHFQELEKLLYNNLYTSGLLPGFLSSSDKKNLHQADEMIKTKNLKMTPEFAANLQSTIQSIEAFLEKSFS